MEMLSEAMSTLDCHVDRLDNSTRNRQILVKLATDVRKSLEGMWDMLKLYNWVDSPPDGTYGVTLLMSP